MDIKVYLLSPGSGELKELLLREALGGISPPDYSGVLYLAPTRLLLENAREAFHRVITSTTGRTCYVPPGAVTLRQHSRSLAQTYGGKTLIPDAAVPALISALEGCGTGLARLLAGFISELKLRYPDERPEGIKKIFDGALREMNLPEEVSVRIADAIGVFGRYNEALAASGVVDDDDALLLSASLAKEHYASKRLILDGFYEITRAEENFISALIERAARTVITIPVSGPPDRDRLDYCWSNFLKARFDVEPLPAPAGKKTENACFYPAPSPEEEMEGIARHIKSSYISGRMGRLDEALVIFPDPEKYRLMAGRVFEKYGIPHQMTAARPASKNRAYLDMLAMLEAVEGNYPRLAFSRFLTSPYFRISPGLKAKTPSVCISAGIVRGKDAWLRAFGALGLYDEARDVFERLAPLEGAKLSFGERLSARLEGVLKSFRFSPGSGEEDAEGPGKILGALRLLESILDNISFSDMKGGCAPGGVAPLVRQMLDIPVESEKAEGVRIAGFFEARGLEPRFLYMAGMKDGDIPARPEMDFFLPDGLRKNLSLPDMKRHLLLQEYIFRRLAASSGALRVSYPAMDGDKFFLPSPFLSGWEGKKERLFGIFSKEEEMRRGKSPATPLSAKEIRGLGCISENTALNVTAIDSYRMCPRLFFMERVLGLTPPEIKEYEVEPETLGSIAHEVMEKLITQEPGDIGAFKKRAPAVLDETLRKWPIENYFKTLIKETFLSILPEIHKMEEDLRKNGCSFLEAERRVEGEPLAGIRLKGKIDRIDIEAGGALHIIDYKTGAVALSRSGVLERGESLQLFLYAALLKGMGLEPRRAGLYSLKDLSVKWIPSGKDDKEGRDIEPYIESSLKYLKETVNDMRKGDFPARPLKEQTCRGCHERPYCPRITQSPEGR